MRFSSSKEAHDFLRTCKAEKIVVDRTAKIYRKHVLLGKNIGVGAYSVIGKIGFGFERFPGLKDYWTRVNHVGKVVIEDDVEIGANCAIDRAKLEETRICKGTKMDNFVHIAHNCNIGPRCLIAAGAVIGGSVTVGADTFIGLNATIKDHVKIGENVTVGSGANVVKDVPPNAVVVSKNVAEILRFQRPIGSRV